VSFLVLYVTDIFGSSRIIVADFVLFIAVLRLDVAARVLWAAAFVRRGGRRFPLGCGDGRGCEASGASRGDGDFGCARVYARVLGSWGGSLWGSVGRRSESLHGTPWFPGVAGGCAHAATRPCPETACPAIGFFRGISSAFSSAGASATGALYAASAVLTLSRSVSVCCS
jgi:hypothetical protein